MANIVVITFDDPDEAGKVRESLRKLEKSGRLSLDDAVVLVKDSDGKMHVKDETDRGTKTGAVGGSLLGLFIGGLIFPFAGLIIGGIAGGLVGKSLGEGVDKKFINEVKEAMQPGSSAIFVLVRDSDPDTALAVMRQYKGNIYHTSLDPEAEKSLQDALK